MILPVKNRMWAKRGGGQGVRYSVLQSGQGADSGQPNCWHLQQIDITIETCSVECIHIGTYLDYTTWVNSAHERERSIRTATKVSIPSPTGSDSRHTALRDPLRPSSPASSEMSGGEPRLLISIDIGTSQSAVCVYYCTKGKAELACTSHPLTLVCQVSAPSLPVLRGGPVRKAPCTRRKCLQC